MKIRQSTAIAFLLIATACAGSPADQAAGETTATTGSSDVIELPHLTVDPSDGQIVLSAEVCLRSGSLELLVCKAGTKEYESIMRTEAQAAHLHAALLMLGLSPGKPAEWSGDTDEARFLPPRGADLEITLRWLDRDGSVRESAAERWLATEDKTPLPRRWVFVGSEILRDGRYWADVDGDVISVANFPSAAIDVPFESTTDNPLLLYEADTERIPPVGTPVEVIIEPVEGAESAEHARALLEIDRDGRMLMDGEPVTAEGLTAWADGFRTRHAKPRVVARPDPRALVWDITRARSQLRLGGVRDIDVRYLPADAPILPRSHEQANADLLQWREKFENPRDFIRDPGAEAERHLQQILSEIDRLELRRELLTRYARELREDLEQYTASTQPAEESGNSSGR